MTYKDEQFIELVLQRCTHVVVVLFDLSMALLPGILKRFGHWVLVRCFMFCLPPLELGNLA